MSDIRELLHDAAEPPSELDLERVQRDGRRRQRRPLKIAGAVVAIVAVAAVVTVRVADDDQHTAPVIAPPPTAAPAPTTPVPATTPATTAPPVTTIPVGEDRLSSESRLGYAGLGPIKLGMMIEDAERAARVVIENTGCGFDVRPEAGTGLAFGDIGVLRDASTAIVQIEVSTPSIRTISGIHIGSTRDEVFRTYPNATEGDDGMITITNQEGRGITFFMTGDEVEGMVLWQGERRTINPLC